MDFFLDMKTMIITLVIGHLFTAVLIRAAWRHHKKDETVSIFFTAKCLQAIAWCFLILRGGVADVLTVSVVNTLIFVGDSMELLAVLKLQNLFHSITKKIYYFLTAANVIGFHLILAFQNEESLRIAFASIGTAALIIIPAYRMIMGRSSSLLAKYMGYFYLLVISFFFARGIAVLFSNNSMGIFTPGIIQTITLLALYLIMILGNTGFVLLLKEKADQELLRLASYDDLTGTLNRRTFVSRAKECLTLYARKKKPVSLLLFDVDHFKKINDTHGHSVGDLVLQDLAARIMRHVKADALFGRYGGDEFAILLPGMDEHESTECAEEIKRLIAGSIIQGLPVSYTLSMGLLTVIPAPKTKLETLYISCDKALYGAKENGRNCAFRIPCSLIDEAL